MGGAKNHMRNIITFPHHIPPSNFINLVKSSSCQSQLMIKEFDFEFHNLKDHFQLVLG